MFGKLDALQGGKEKNSLLKKSPLYDEAYGDTRDMEKKAKKMQKQQEEAIARQKMTEKRRQAEAESEMGLRRARSESGQYGRRSLLGG